MLACAGLLACSDAARLPDFTELVEEAAPAIVNISGKAEDAPAMARKLPPLFRWFEDFMDPEQGGEKEAPGPQTPGQSLGSGFVLSEDGEILTNHHVVARADEIIVTLADQRQFKAQVLGRDPASDLALLKIEAKGLPFLRFGDSDELKVGAWVLAIGSPFGFEHSVTAGIVSAKGRALGSEQYVPFIQTDVAINPGNSGGPLFNLDGEVVGINSQIFSQTGGYMGLSFAIPATTAVSVVEQLREHGRVRRAWLGVVIQRVDRALAQSFGLPQPTGALVSHIDAAGPAAEAGMQAGDVILEIDGVKVPDSGALSPMIGRRAPGEKIKIGILRNGERSSLRAKLGELPVAGQTDAEDWTGLQLEALSARQRDRLKLDHGLAVRAVDAGAPAALAGLRPGDVILSWAGEMLASETDWLLHVSALRPGESAPLLVLRRQQSLFIALQRPEPIN